MGTTIMSQIEHRECPRCKGNGTIPSDGIGSEMRRLRMSHGIGMREMARRIKVTVAYLGRMETNEQAFTAGIVERYEAEFKKGKS